VKFLVDNNLPVALARWIATQGADVKHIRTLNWSEKDDYYLWQFAIRENRILISKDQDFLNLSAVWVIADGCYGAVLEISEKLT
jgi:predicted nuclease of predicted toxin-antitoxin system